MEQRWPRGGRRSAVMGWPVASQQRWRPSWLGEFTLDGGMFYVPPRGDLTIGIPGAAAFGVATDWAAGSGYLRVVHAASGSIVNDIPATGTVSVPDPYADRLATGFTFDSAAFPRPTAGYTIGTAGAQHFGIATDLDTSTAIIDPIHTASLSVM